MLIHLYKTSICVRLVAEHTCAFTQTMYNNIFTHIVQYENKESTEELLIGLTGKFTHRDKFQFIQS